MTDMAAADNPKAFVENPAPHRPPGWFFPTPESMEEAKKRHRQEEAQRNDDVDDAPF